MFFEELIEQHCIHGFVAHGVGLAVFVPSYQAGILTGCPGKEGQVEFLGRRLNRIPYWPHWVGEKSKSPARENAYE